MAYTSSASTSSSFNPSLSLDDNFDSTEQRLAGLEELNARIAEDKSLYRASRERWEAALMTRPVGAGAAYSIFGLLIGTLPPASVAFSMATGIKFTPSRPPFVILFLLAAVATGITAALTGRRVASIIKTTERFRQPNRAALVVLTGTMWGIVSGAVGGLFLFIVGAFFAALVGGLIGAVTVQIFVVLHNLMRRGDLIELKHLLPIAFGISLTVCAFVLGR